MDENELRDIFARHVLWLNGKQGGEQVNLQGADLRWVKLQGVSLQRADLRWASLMWSNLQGADLQGADLQEAKLQGANLQNADLREAQLQGAYLQVANLREAKLQGANLIGANLRGANLHGTNLHGVNLDFSCWPLHCNSKAKVDKRIAQQLAAHFCCLDCDDLDYIKARDAIMAFAKGSHVARWLLNESED